MGTGRLPDRVQDRGRSRRRRPTVLRVVAIAVFLAGASYRLGSISATGRGAVEPPPGPAPLLVKVAPATWYVGRTNRVSLSFPDLPEAAAVRDVFLAVPELGWTRRVTTRELRQGIREEFRPETPGLFRVRVFSDGLEVGERAIAIAPARERVGPDARWSLKAGLPHLLDSGAFEIPVYAAVERARDGVFVPTLIREGERLTLEDRDTGRKFGLLRIPAGQSLSNRVGVPIDARSSFQLVASNNGKKIRLGPLPLNWSNNGPRLRLSATPARQETPAGVDAGAMVGLYLTYEGRPAVPSKPIPIEVEATADVHVFPPPPLTLGAGSRFVACRLSHPGTEGLGDATVGFRDPAGATDCAVNVRFAIPWPFYALAAVCGGFAVLVNRRLYRDVRPRWRVGLEVVIGGVAAVAFYQLVLSGWFRAWAGCPLGLDTFVALLVGLGGGLLGLTASDLLVGFPRISTRARGGPGIGTGSGSGSGTGSGDESHAPPALVEPTSPLGNYI